MNEPVKEKRMIASLVRGLRILEHIVAANNGTRVSEISVASDVPSSNVTLFLSSLVSTGYVIKSPTNGRYYASEKLVHMASRIDTPYRRLEFAASQEMQRLHEMYDENILLAVLNGFRLQFISTLQSTRNIQILNNDDRSFEPHVTAAGKAILAFLPEGMLARHIANTVFDKYTDKTITDPDAVRRELVEVKARGYATNRGEYEDEIMAVAAPVFMDDRVEGSLVVQFPTFRYRESDLESHASVVIAAAKSISAALREQES